MHISESFTGYKSMMAEKSLLPDGDIPDDAETAILLYGRMVVSEAVKMCPHDMPVMDLIQEGNIGIVKALKHFDRSRGISFTTYLMPIIRRVMIDFMRKSMYPVNVSRFRPERNAERQMAEAEHCEDVSDVVPLMVDKGFSDMEDGMDAASKLMDIGPLESAVIRLRYGIGCDGEHSQREVARLLGIPKTRVLQIERASMEIMAE